MNIEELTLDVFLSEKLSNKNKKPPLVWMSYQIPERNIGSFQVGNVMEFNTIIAKRITEILKELDFSNLFPNIITQILFHNGSKDGVAFYDGLNDEVLTHKLDSQKYNQIFDFLRLKHPRIFYEPSVLRRSC